MGLLTQRKEHRVPDLSRYDYYYQRKEDYNKSPRLSAAAAYAASRSRGNPVLMQQRSQSFTQPRRVVRTRPRAQSRGAVEGRGAAETPRADSIVRNARAQDAKGRSKSITRRTIRRINGVDYMETVTTTPLEDEDNARHFNEFSEPVDDDAEEYPVRRVRRVRKTAPSSPRSARSTRTQRAPLSPPRSPVTYQQPDDYQYEDAAPAESEYVVPPPVPGTVSSPASVRRTTSTSRPVRSRSTRSVRKPVSGLQPSTTGTTVGGKRLTEQEMYARALEIAQRNVYSGSDFSPEVLDNASSQDGQGISRMGQRSLRRDSGKGKKKFNLFNKDRDAGAGGVLPSAGAPRASGVSSLDNRLGQNVESSRKNVSDEEMYGQALAMSQNKAQRNFEEPELGTRPLNLGGAEREIRSPQSNAAASFVTPAQTIDENYEDNFQDAENYDGEWKDARSKVGPYNGYDYPVENDDRYDFEEPEPEPEPGYRAAAVNEPQAETEDIEPGLEQEYVDPERLPKASTDYEPEYQGEEAYEPVYQKEDQERAPFRRSGGGYSGRSGVVQDVDEGLSPPRRSGGGYSGRSGAGSGLASPIDTTKSGFSNRIASPEEVRAGDLQASGIGNAGTSGRSPKQQAVQSPVTSPLEDAAARGGFDSEADVGGLGGAAGAGSAATDGVGATGGRRKSRGFSSGLSRFKTRKSLFGGKPDEEPLPDLPQTNLAQTERGESQLGNASGPGPQIYEETARESRPKSKIKSMFNKVIEFGAENSGYQPPREVREQQKAEKFGAGALREGDSAVPSTYQQKATGLGDGDGSSPYTHTHQQKGSGLANGVGAGGVATEGADIDGIDGTARTAAVDGTATRGPTYGGVGTGSRAASGSRTASGATTGAATGTVVGGTAAGTSAGAATGGVGKRSGGGSHPWRRNAQPANATEDGVASGRAPAAAATTAPQQPSNHHGTAGPEREEANLSSDYENDQSADEGYADGFADGLRDSQYQSGFERGEKAGGVGGSTAAAGGAGAGEEVADGVDGGFINRSGVQEKLNQAKESSWGQKALGKAKDEAQSQAKEQKGNLFKKLFKK
ncbi:hypothetical protein ZYGR_0AF03300 [Zygosaccharomyces rouxii]|uniref:Meiotic sister-chromatid recombination protein 3 n=1 Tax=Zygosaccharomyces rouxii TaxID=4956 RepID=A0A1Q3A802_ZYGRO|nr:hypothetical protein ZYGR_0AF03300 [Zygosaccharomyces rouxii]